MFRRAALAALAASAHARQLPRPWFGGVAGDSTAVARGSAAAAEPAPALGTADAKVELDPRIVSMLVSRGVGDVAAVEALLRAKTKTPRTFRYESATAALEVLDRAMHGCRRGGVDAAVHVVRKDVMLLGLSASLLETKLAFLQAAEPTGLGMTPAQAGEALASYPRFFTLSATKAMKRIASLRALGIAERLPKMLSSHLAIMGLAQERNFDSKVALLQEFGLDAGLVCSALPAVLSIAEPNLRAKLDFLARVARLPPAVLQKAPMLLAYSLDNRTRPRFFLASQLNLLNHFSLNTVCQRSDEHMLRTVMLGTEVAEWSVPQYRAHITSPEFARAAAAYEAARRAGDA